VNRILDHNWPRESQVIETLVLGCLDRRFKGWRGMFGKHMNFPMSLPITIPGGAKDLVYPNHPRDTEHLLEKIELFGPALKNLVVMAHSGCKDCGERTDPVFYEEMLRRADERLRERFPNKEIFLVFLDFDGIYLVEQEISEAMAIV
jgi:hypothetical protein